MVELYRAEDDALVGSITEEDLHLLIEALEEEDAEDTDYYVDRDTLDYLRDRGASGQLLAVLERALGDQPGVDVYYLPEGATEEA